MSMFSRYVIWWCDSFFESMLCLPRINWNSSDRSSRRHKLRRIEKIFLGIGEIAEGIASGWLLHRVNGWIGGNFRIRVNSGGGGWIFGGRWWPTAVGLEWGVTWRWSAVLWWPVVDVADGQRPVKMHEDGFIFSVATWYMREDGRCCLDVENFFKWWCGMES
jgi:hypothetical protein